MYQEALKEVSIAISLHESHRSYPSRRRACFQFILVILLTYFRMFTSFILFNWFNLVYLIYLVDLAYLVYPVYRGSQGKKLGRSFTAS